LLVDIFPGHLCGDVREIDGADLRSSQFIPGHSYDDSECVMRFVSSLSRWTSKRLMLNFEIFDISDRTVELSILGTSGPDVRLFHFVAVTGPHL